MAALKTAPFTGRKSGGASTEGNSNLKLMKPYSLSDGVYVK